VNRSRARYTKPILIAAICAIVVAALGATMTDLSPWYYSLREPAWKPPDWLFGPAWTTIYALSAWAGVLAWRDARSDGARRRIIWLFAVNAILNVLWSALFFRLERPDWALIETGLFWLSIAALIVGLGSIARSTRWLLAPYLVWVTYASALNYAVVRLNGPFGHA
jgi:tryptophan-rich sensory protein